MFVCIRHLSSWRFYFFSNLLQSVVSVYVSQFALNNEHISVYGPSYDEHLCQSSYTQSSHLLKGPILYRQWRWDRPGRRTAWSRQCAGDYGNKPVPIPSTPSGETELSDVSMLSKLERDPCALSSHNVRICIKIGSLLTFRRLEMIHCTWFSAGLYQELCCFVMAYYHFIFAPTSLI